MRFYFIRRIVLGKIEQMETFAGKFILQDHMVSKSRFVHFTAVVVTYLRDKLVVNKKHTD